MLNTQKNTHSKPREQTAADAGQHIKDGFQPPRTITEELCIHVGQSASLRKGRISEPLSPAENETSTTSTAIGLESLDGEMARHEFQSLGMSQDKQETKLFSETHLQVMLNLDQQSASAY
jgi:hypothetical protein